MMRRVLVLSIFAGFFAALPASAQNILPASAAGWTNTGEPAVLRVATAQPVLAEYGVVASQEGVYAKGSESFDALVYKLKDSSDAYGLYSFLQQPEMRRANFTDHSAISADRALVLVGNFVLDVRVHNPAAASRQLDALVAALSSQAEVGSLPILPSYLPEAGRINFSDRYILGSQALDQLFPGGIGSSVGFNRSGEAELAHYRLGGRDATLLIVGLPTDQLAAQQLAELQKNFNVNGDNQTSGTPLYAKRDARLLAIVAGARNQAEANTLLDQIQMETERSWNEPVPKHEPPIELMIEGSIIGSIIICLFALVAGFSFGGIRLLVKRFAPGKVFDRNVDLQVLQLGLGSKPINSDDFYSYSAPAGPAPTVDKNLPDRVALRLFR
jgi:hypothetical protein